MAEISERYLFFIHISLVAEDSESETLTMIRYILRLKGTQVSLFGSLPGYCLICEKSFDKKNKEMVQSWYVIVREQEEKANLYCPECWQRGNKFISELQEELENARKS